MIIGANMPWQYIDEDFHLIMPWYTVPALQWLKRQDLNDWDVFEYGAGYSTTWWRANCRSITSVEFSESWSRAMEVFNEIEEDNYVKFSEVHNDYLWNCIIVDGHWRLECVEFCRKFIKSGGYLIIDNWGQEDFPHTHEAEKLLEGWEMQLFKQPNHRTWITAIFKKP